MKDVISVDSVLDDSYIPIIIPDVNRAKLKKLLHSLLISKLPENREHDCDKGVCAQKDNKDGYNSAIDDMRKSIDELFEVKK